jgi:proteic killer suppression protein
MRRKRRNHNLLGLPESSRYLSAGIQPSHAKKLNDQLTVLNAATSPGQMNIPGWQFHALSAEFAGHWAVSVNGNWRLTFRFEGEDAILVDYQDYH